MPTYVITGANRGIGVCASIHPYIRIDLYVMRLNFRWVEGSAFTDAVVGICVCYTVWIPAATVRYPRKPGRRPRARQSRNRRESRKGTTGKKHPYLTSWFDRLWLFEGLFGCLHAPHTPHEWPAGLVSANTLIYSKRRRKWRGWVTVLIYWSRTQRCNLNGRLLTASMSCAVPPPPCTAHILHSSTFDIHVATDGLVGWFVVRRIQRGWKKNS